MASGLIVGGFDFDTGDVELATVQQAHVGAATLGTAAMEAIEIAVLKRFRIKNPYETE